MSWLSLFILFNMFIVTVCSLLELILHKGNRKFTEHILEWC